MLRNTQMEKVHNKKCRTKLSKLLMYARGFHTHSPLSYRVTRKLNLCWSNVLVSVHSISMLWNVFSLENPNISFIVCFGGKYYHRHIVYDLVSWLRAISQSIFRLSFHIECDRNQTAHEITVINGYLALHRFDPVITIWTFSRYKLREPNPNGTWNAHLSKAKRKRKLCTKSSDYEAHLPQDNRNESLCFFVCSAQSFRVDQNWKRKALAKWYRIYVKIT